MTGTEWKDEGEKQAFEAALARALRRIDAPEGFAARVAALAEAESRTATAAEAERMPWWRRALGVGSSGIGWKPAWGGAAALLVAGVLAGHVVREHHTEAASRARAEASRQFDVSLEITDRAMEHAREQLQRNGVRLDGEQ